MRIVGEGRDEPTCWLVLLYRLFYRVMLTAPSRLHDRTEGFRRDKSVIKRVIRRAKHRV